MAGPRGKKGRKRADPESSVSSSSLPSQGDTASFSIDESTKSFHQPWMKAKQPHAALIVIRGQHQGRRFSLKGDEIVLGRAEDALIRFDDPATSKHHARLSAIGEDWVIEDLGSTNGTRVNKRKVTKPAVLRKEDVITIGTTVLKYLPAGEEEIVYLGKLEEAAYKDSTTGIYNQNYMREALEAEFKRTGALHSRLAVIVFDVDRFKQVNDRYGHLAGDYVLKEIAKVIRSHCLRDSDIFGRFGGDEFMILLLNTYTLMAASRVAQQIRKVVSEHRFSYEKQDLPVAISLGVAVLNERMNSLTDLLKSADQALYHAKQNGRNRVALAVGTSPVIGFAEEFNFSQEKGQVTFRDEEKMCLIEINERTGAEAHTPFTHPSRKAG